jgi:hypothetical protein
MKPSVKILIGAAIATSAWIPISFADRRDIPLGAGIIAIIGCAIGCLVVIDAVFRWLLTPGKCRLERKWPLA